MVARVLGGLRDLFHHVGRRGQIGVPHAQIDNVLAPPARRAHQLDHLAQTVRRQSIELVEVVLKALGHGDRALTGSRHGVAGPLGPHCTEVSGFAPVLAQSGAPAPRRNQA